VLRTCSKREPESLETWNPAHLSGSWFAPQRRMNERVGLGFCRRG
jgi:hypothetical protein